MIFGRIDEIHVCRSIFVGGDRPRWASQSRRLSREDSRRNCQDASQECELRIGGKCFLLVSGNLTEESALTGIALESVPTENLANISERFLEKIEGFSVVDSSVKIGLTGMAPV
ncbi:MAG: hypothetical protein ACI8T1_005128 [Verrucomicrobiales bacterium]